MQLYPEPTSTLADLGIEQGALCGAGHTLWLQGLHDGCGRHELGPGAVEGPWVDHDERAHGGLRRRDVVWAGCCVSGDRSRLWKAK